MTRGPVLLGEMVRLRPIEARDADRMWESLQDPESNRLTGTTATFTRDQIDEWSATISEREGRYDWEFADETFADLERCATVSW